MTLRQIVLLFDRVEEARAEIDECCNCKDISDCPLGNYGIWNRCSVQDLTYFIRKLTEKESYGHD